MWLILALTLFFSLLVFCYYKLIKNVTQWKNQRVPHPPASMLFGNMTDLVLLKKPLPQIYIEIYNKFPTLPYVGFYKVRTPAILIRDPDLAKSILTTHFHSFDKNDLDIDISANPLIAKNPFFISGEQWKISRAQVTPSFTTKQMKFNFTLMQQVCHKLIDFLDDPIIANGGIEVKDLCHKYTMDLVALCSMGLEANSFKSSHSEIIKAAKDILSPDFITNLKYTLLFLIPSLTKLFKVAFIPETSENYFKGIIGQTIKYRRTNQIVKHDFLNTMLDLQEKLGEDRFTVTDITTHALSFFIDGFESTAVLLSFALYELGANRGFQDELRKEVKDKMKRENRDIDYDFVQEFTILNNIINETLRLHPPLMFLGKKCSKEFELPALETGGKPLTIKAETPVIIPIYSIQNDDKYFPEPHTFNPHRFNNNSDVLKKGIFSPFGDGPRTCIGQRFALAQAKAAIIYIVLNFDIRVNNKTITPLELDPQNFFAAVKGGLWLNFIKHKKID